jgi:16S rRNA (adenine1518-N6/adenine1519-N6)-dimethyltransferase
MGRKWGQHFLSDGSVARRIVDALGAGPADAVLEIGPGRGALTKHLLGRTARLTAVEVDRALFEALSVRGAGVPGWSIVHRDFLKWPLPSDGPYRVIGNLPYNAANAILRKLLDWDQWTEAVVMVQKEVADRIQASPGGRDYGILSLAVQSRAGVELLFNVPPGAFRPPPRVMSTVLRLRRRTASRVADEAAFFRVLHAAFGQRRKTLLNSLAHGLDMGKDAVRTALEKEGIDPGRRAETLNLEEFDQLSIRLKAIFRD